MDDTRAPLRKFAAPEYVFGSGASALAGAYAKKFGVSKVLLVSDPGVEDTGAVDRVAASLRASGIRYEYFSSVSPNPRDSEVRLGADRYRTALCDAVVAVGGGSPLDCAKAIGLMAANSGKDVLDFEGIDAVPLPGPPLVCVPTTAGTGAELSQFAIVNAVRKGVKIAIVSKKAIPDAALIDPELCFSMPPGLTAATGMDALSHALEALSSTAASPMTDLNALKAVSLVSEFLPRAVADGGDREAREGMALASLLAGLAFSNAGLGVVHALSHALGGELDLPHGLCNALLLGACLRYNSPSAPRAFLLFTRSLAEGFCSRGVALKGLPSQDSAACADEVRALAAAALPAAADMVLQLRSEIGLEEGLSAHGLTAAAIPGLAAKAYRDACLATNPRAATRPDLEALYAAAL